MKDYLGFTVIAAIVTTIGTLIGLFIKDFLLVQYFDSIREKRTLKKISKKYKDPILLASNELARRINELVDRYEIVSKGFTKANLFNKAEYIELNFADDPYFLKYKLISTLYRFCAFFGWLELYRQDITFLDSSSHRQNLKSFIILGKIREALADGQIVDEPDFETWKDVLIFREELRSIGEGMIEIVKDQRMVIGYGKFQSIIEGFEQIQKPLWLRPTINFFTEFRLKKDFRLKRITLLKSYLDEFIKCLDKEYYERYVKAQM